MGRVLVAAFFAAALLQFSHPLADGDLWWHLATGRYVVEHGGLPDGDPFSYTVSPSFQQRARMLVRANWLAQVAYHGLYVAGGFQALRLFNALLFTGVVAIVYHVLRLHGLARSWALLMVAPLCAFCWFYDEVRPLGFSVLLTATSLWILERARLRELGAWGLAPLVPLCAAWANLHRGFPVMSLNLVPYAVAALALRRSREAAMLLAALAATLLNPSLAAPWLAAAEESLQGAAAFGILELATPLEFARLEAGGAGTSFLPLLVAIAALSGILLLAARDRARPEHVLLWALLAFAGATAFRYSIYFAIGALVAAAPTAARLLKGTATARLERGLPAAVLAASCALTITASPPTLRAIDDQALPARAVDALLAHALPPPLFNTFDHGGYLIWRAWPRYQVFADSRLLDYSVFRELVAAERDGLAPLLARRGINTVLYPTFDRRLRVRPAVLELLADPGWVLVHYDGVATLFVRRSAAPATPEASERDFADQLLAVIAHRAQGRLGPADLVEQAAVLRAVRREAEARQLLAGS